MQGFKGNAHRKKIYPGIRHQHDESRGVWQRISWHRFANYSFGDAATEIGPKVWLDNEKEEGNMAFTISEAATKDVYHIERRNQDN